jgi:hypothetical protein
MNSGAEQSSQGGDRVVEACLFTFSEQNGFIQITVNCGVDGELYLMRKSRYFTEQADVQQFASAISSDNGDEPTFMHIFYDHTLHGTPKCPYLVVKMSDGSATDLKRKDYMAATKAIDK